MKSRELEGILQRFSGYASSEIDQRTRFLRSQNLIPHGPRGANAPHLDSLHVALMILSLVSRKAVDAGHIINRSKDLELVPRKGCSLAPTPLAPALAAAFELGPGYIEHFEIAEDGAIAWVIFCEKGRRVRVLFADDPRIKKDCAQNPERYDRQGASKIGHRFVFPRAAWDAIVGEFKRHDDDKSGWRAPTEDKRVTA